MKIRPVGVEFFHEDRTDRRDESNSRFSQFCYNPYKLGGPGSSVSIATGNGLDGPAIESRWREIFRPCPRPALWPTQPPVQWVPGLSRG